MNDGGATNSEGKEQSGATNSVQISNNNNNVVLTNGV